MRKKKGFTLIELLAVILILAVLALIATPMVIKYIDSAKKDSLTSSLMSVERSALTYFTSNNIKTKTLIDLTENNLDIQNDGFEKGIAVGDRNGVKVYFYKEGFCNIKEDDKIIVKEVPLDKCDFNVEKTSTSTNVIKTEEKVDNYVISTPETVVDADGFGSHNATSNTYLIKVKLSGKNLLDKNQFKLAGLQNETGISAWGSTALDNDWVLANLKPNTKYTISYDVKCLTIPEYDTKSSGNLGFLLYSGKKDESGKSFSSLWLTTINNRFLTLGEELFSQKTITTPSTLHSSLALYKFYVYTNYYKKDNKATFASIQFKNVQIEEGSEATAYEPYMEPIEYTIELSAPLRRFEDVTDEISSSLSSVIRRVGVREDGTLYKLDKPVYESIELPEIPNVNQTIIVTISDDNIEATDNVEVYYK